jgi:hypothetical protein
MDAAYWRKGCSSLGRLRFAVLIAAGRGKSECHCLIDVKEATATAAPRSQTAEMPRDNAERVVASVLHMSPFLGGRMLAARILEKPVFIRELLPQNLKLEIETLSRDEAMNVAEFLPMSWAGDMPGKWAWRIAAVGLPNFSATATNHSTPLPGSGTASLTSWRRTRPRISTTVAVTRSSRVPEPRGMATPLVDACSH